MAKITKGRASAFLANASVGQSDGSKGDKGGHAAPSPVSSTPKAKLASFFEGLVKKEVPRIREERIVSKRTDAGLVQFCNYCEEVTPFETIKYQNIPGGKVRETKRCVICKGVYDSYKRFGILDVAESSRGTDSSGTASSSGLLQETT